LIDSLAGTISSARARRTLASSVESHPVFLRSDHRLIVPAGRFEKGCCPASRQGVMIRCMMVGLQAIRRPGHPAAMEHPALATSQLPFCQAPGSKS
jgi:hypothetical protein